MKEAARQLSLTKPSERNQTQQRIAWKVRLLIQEKILTDEAETGRLGQNQELTDQVEDELP